MGNRTGSRYLWLRYLQCRVFGHQAPYWKSKGEWVEIGELPDGNKLSVFREGMRLEYVCPRCGDDVTTPERETL